MHLKSKEFSQTLWSAGMLLMLFVTMAFFNFSVTRIWLAATSRLITHEDHRKAATFILLCSKLINRPGFSLLKLDSLVFSKYFLFSCLPAILSE